MPFVTADDGAQIFYKDWGSGGSPVVLSHGWPLNADAWDAGARFLAEQGHRVIAHDRRGHGRSTQTWHGNEMDTYADDLAILVEALDLRDRSQLYRDLADGPFFGHNRNHDIDQGFRDAFWLQGMACGHRAAHECIAAFSATDFRPDLAAVDVPTLVIHGDDDQIVPFDVGGRRSAELVAGAVLKVYEGSGHALPDTDRDRLHADLLAFIDS